MWVSAQIRSDDHRLIVDVDARPWLNLLNEDQVALLIRGGAAAASLLDDLERYYDDDEEVMDLATYLSVLHTAGHEMGFHVDMDEDEFDAWAEENHPHLLT